MTEQELANIIEEIRAGNNEPLAIIFKKYSDYCIAPLLRKTSCTEDDARDIFVEAVMNFREKILDGRVTAQTPVKSYMYHTCWNMWLKKSKKKQRFVRAPEDDIRFFDKHLYQNMEAEGVEYDHLVAQEEELEAKEKKKQLIRMTKESLSDLGENCQKILKWFIIEKKSMKEIAELMDFANANVAKTTKSRCYKRWVKKAHSLYKNA